MSRMRSFPTLLAVAALAAAGCNLAPDYQQPPAPIAGAWPIAPTIPVAGTAGSASSGDAAGHLAGADVAVADVGWRDFLVDERLEQLVALALDSNRDFRTAVLNVERVRAQYAIRRAERLPWVDASAVGVRQRIPESQTGIGEALTVSSYGFEVGVTSYEVDLFGRVRNLSQAALERYFASEEARRSAQISLIGQVANAYLILAADRELLRLAEETLKTQEDSFRLTQRRHELGAVSGLELNQERTTIEQARVDVARYAGDVSRDVNALTFLVGAPIDPALLPPGFESDAAALPVLPAGLPSEVLLRRPDVLEAEHFLRGAHADIGAARAAFLPRISLTGSAGATSDELSTLFDGGSGVWTFIPRIDIPIFQGGRLRAGLRVTEVDRDIAVAQYERTIQEAFREVSDGLTLTDSLDRQLAAQLALVEAAGRAYELSEARYEAGRDNYLLLLDSLRTYYRAQQGLIAIRLLEQANRVALYRALGGGWRETTEAAPSDPPVESGA